MSRPPGPKKLAAIEQVASLRAQKIPEAEIFQALIESGLTKVQARELVPVLEAQPIKVPERLVDDEIRNANIQGAIHFLETIAKRLNGEIVNRFPETVGLSGDALTWARKLKGVM